MLRLLKRFSILLLLLLVSASSIFSTDVDLIALFREYENDLKPISMAIAGAYLNKPKIELVGVYTTKGDGVLPRRIEFRSSDASEYLYALNNPRSKGFFGLFSTLTSAFSPLVSKAQEMLEERDFKKGEVVVDGWIDILESEKLDLISMLLDSDFSSLDFDVSGEIALSGERDIAIVFSLCVSSDEANNIYIDFNDLCLDGNAIKTGPIMISFSKQ